MWELTNVIQRVFLCLNFYPEDFSHTPSEDKDI